MHLASVSNFLGKNNHLINIVIVPPKSKVLTHQICPSPTPSSYLFLSCLIIINNKERMLSHLHSLVSFFFVFMLPTWVDYIPFCYSLHFKFCSQVVTCFQKCYFFQKFLYILLDFSCIQSSCFPQTFLSVSASHLFSIISYMSTYFISVSITLLKGC